MKNTMEYKGYIGSVEFSEGDGIFFGKVMGIRSLISYGGTDAKSLVEDFHGDRKSTRLNSSHTDSSRMPSSA